MNSVFSSPAFLILLLFFPFQGTKTEYFSAELSTDVADHWARRCFIHVRWPCFSCFSIKYNLNSWDCVLTAAHAHSAAFELYQCWEHSPVEFMICQFHQLLLDFWNFRIYLWLDISSFGIPFVAWEKGEIETEIIGQISQKLDLDGKSKYKMSRKCQASSQQENKSWKKSWEFRDQFQQKDRAGSMQ